MPTNLAKSGSILALLAAMFVVSCGGGGDEETPLSPPIGSIIGVWTARVATVASGCNALTGTRIYG